MYLKNILIITCFSLTFACRAIADDFSIIINEINYNSPAHGELTSEQLEWIELYNRSAKEIDISNWSFTNGIMFEFPGSTTIPGNGYLVVCRDVSAFHSVWGEMPTAGNFGLRLSDGGERVTLCNADGLVVDTVLYKDSFPWSETPDGFGTSLELIDPETDNDDPYTWEASAFVDGTPGRPNSCIVKRVSLIGNNSLWHFWRGSDEPSGEAGAWITTDYDDSGWETGEAPFGFGDSEFYFTHLNDMRDQYSTLFLRQTFEVEDPSDLTQLRLAVDFDDGFVAYINGKEVARMVMITTGIPDHSEHAAGSHESGSPSVWTLSAGILNQGSNSISIVAANGDTSGSDFIINASLSGIKIPDNPPPPNIVINEIGAELSNFWVEIFNASYKEINLDDYFLAFESEDLSRHQLSGNIKHNEYAVFSFTPSPAFSGTAILSRGEENQFVSSLKYSVSIGTSWGLRPGNLKEAALLSEPTPGEENKLPDLPEIYITELNYHPASEDDRDEFVEIFNSGDSTVDLSGWQLGGGIRFIFPQGTSISSKKYLLIVPDSEHAASLYTDPEISYIGNFSGSLSNSGERIYLKDSQGNHVVDFLYADDGDWPQAPDGPSSPPDSNDPYDTGGQGMTLELRDIALDPKAGGSWTAETEGGTPGKPRANPETDIAPVISDLFFSPLLPTPGRGVLFNVKVQCPTEIKNVELIWQFEGAADWNTLELTDDGLNGDGKAEDGTWGGFLVSLTHKGTVLFYFKSEAVNGSVTRWPRNLEMQPFLLRVEETPMPDSASQDLIYIVMTDGDLNTLRTRNVNSDRLLPCAVIKDGRNYQLAKIRYRGSSSRHYTPKSYRVELTNNQTAGEAKYFYLHGDEPIRQYIGMSTFRRAGIPGPQIKLVSLGMGDGFWTGYARVEREDEAFANRYFTGDDGNLYRGVRCGNRSSTLQYFGDDPSDYECGYAKQTNKEEADWSDIVQLCAALNSTPDVYLDQIDQILDVDQWCRYFAVHTVLSNQENSIYREAGDDYFLYRRKSDGRFILLPWDMDSVFQEPEERLFRPDLPAIRRFLTHPAIAPRYWYHLDKLIDRTFSAQAVNRSIAEAEDQVGGTYINIFTSFRDQRTEFIRRQLAKAITSCGLVTQNTTQYTPLISLHSDWQYFKGTENPSDDLLWTEIDFDDSTWNTGAAGFGYGDDDDNTFLDDMQYGYTTVYIRKTFSLDSVNDLTNYNLSIDYDDAFVCYLNGHEILRRNVGTSGEILQFDAEADGGHEAGTPEYFDLAPFVDNVVAGENILAIIGVNARPTSSDFSLNPAILPKDSDITGRPAGCGSQIYAPEGSEINLSGLAPVTQTSYVSVNGGDAGYNVLTGKWNISFNNVPEQLMVTAWDFSGQVVETEAIDVLRKQPTTVPSTISSDLTLSKDQSPYIFNGTTVAQAVTLTIEAGCELIGGEIRPLRIRGELNITGTAGEPVIFRRGTEGQDALITVDGGKAVLQHAAISPGDSELPGTDNSSGAVNLKSGELSIENCTFEGVPFYCVVAQGGTLNIDNCTFSGSGGGLLIQDTACSVSESEFKFLGPRDAINHRDGGELTVTNSSFHDLERSGINTTMTATISGSSFLDISGSALAFSGSSTGSTDSTLIVNSGTGISLQFNASCTFDHVTLVDNNLALSVKTSGGGTSNVNIKNSILWDNYQTLLLQGAATYSLSYSLLQDKDPDASNHNITSNPLFTDPGQNDWTLTKESPALRRADDSSDLGAFQRSNINDPLLGDINNDKRTNLADAIALLAYLFQGGDEPWCLSIADTNGDGSRNLSDAVYLLLYLFANGDPPVEPSPPCP